MIGTQLVTKGYHFPNLTLVGVVDADLGLSGGDLRAAERTFQQIHQVSGRAGRGDKPGRVLVQTHDPAAPRDAGAGLAAMPRASTPPRPTPAATPPCRPSAGSPRSSSPREDQAEANEVARLIGRAAPQHREYGRVRPRPRPARHAARPPPPPPARPRRPPVPVQDIIRDWLGGLQWKASTRVAVDVDPYSFL